ncbi:uncharacterized protein EI97DRAFT_156444 [Westerdykella ornata]|uniref:Uncharacterized protein n=1 Tax=Westerdykella ornata TaxID=318751 RepID=A0A6A6JAU9_WESOR|nr:uncharacterized protein EI97DRAFT_156444 [Westerdykella ornata]KAF2273405.1 hypothetical protein EI97DRAFT_156444 [Westerdykella ornata]
MPHQIHVEEDVQTFFSALGRGYHKKFRSPNTFSADAPLRRAAGADVPRIAPENPRTYQRAGHLGRTSSADVILRGAYAGCMLLFPKLPWKGFVSAIQQERTKISAQDRIPSSVGNADEMSSALQGKPKGKARSQKVPGSHTWPLSITKTAERTDLLWIIMSFCVFSPENVALAPVLQPNFRTTVGQAI